MGSDPLFTFYVNRRVRAALLAASVIAAGCNTTAPAKAPGISEDAKFTEAAHQYLEARYAWQPTWATGLGIHKYDDRLEDYSKKVFEQSTAATEKLLGAKSFDKAVEVQSDYAKSAYETFVAEATKLGELYADLAKEAYKPFETHFGKAPLVK